MVDGAIAGRILASLARLADRWRCLSARDRHRLAKRIETDLIPTTVGSLSPAGRTAVLEQRQDVDHACLEAMDPVGSSAIRARH
jgi:hypothetical protein